MLVRAVALSLTGLAGAMRLPRTQVPRVANVAARGLRVSRPALMVEEGAQAKGTCAWFDTTKGFGFINIDGEDGPDIFVHQTDIYARGFRSLSEGEPVEFMVSKDARSGKLKAIEVRRARDAPPPAPDMPCARVPNASARVQGTGPDGNYVQGAPREPRYNDDEY